MSAVRPTPAASPSPLSPAERHFLRTVAEDTEDAPWMVMNDRQFWSASGLAWSLDSYARRRGLPWYVGGMLPLTYQPAGAVRRKQVAPDTFVAFIAQRERDSLDIEAEGMPPFVLEVVSKSSVKHDLTEKTELYRLLGAQEYAIARLDLVKRRLDGYRRGEDGAWQRWVPDGEGRLWSAVLGLWLILHGGKVRAMTPEGVGLPTLHEAEEQRAQAEEALHASEAARRQAEAEVARLQAALDRLKRGDDDRHE